MINHPSYANTGCTEQDVSQAINASVTSNGELVMLSYSEGAAEMLARECEWESDDEYHYRGTDCDGRRWEIALSHR